MNNHIKQLAHQPITPLSIEREWNNGHEMIMIEGVKYDAEYFRMFATPEADVLYAVRRDEFGSVTLTTIRNVDEAKKFFDETLPPPPYGHLPPLRVRGERPNLGEGEQYEENEDGI